MTVTVDSFKERFVNFQGFSDEIIQQNLTESSLFFPFDSWKDETVRNLAILLLTAHNLELERQSTLDLGDRLMNQRGVSDFESPILSPDYCALTRYGKRLQDLINSQILGVMLI